MDDFEILGLRPAASEEELRQAYRDLIKVWHPDRFSHDPRLQHKAQEKLKEINAAYERIKSTPSAQGQTYSSDDAQYKTSEKQAAPPPPPPPPTNDESGLGEAEIIEKPQLLHIPVSRLIVMSIVSMSIYEMYWFYMNWRYVKKRDGLNIRPFWRSVFGVFYCHSLLRRIHEDKDARSVQMPSFSPGGLATGWVILMIIAQGVNRLPSIKASIIAAFIPSFLCLIPIQNYINTVSDKRNPGEPYYGWSSGHVVLLVFGVIFWAFLLFGLASETPVAYQQPSSHVKGGRQGKIVTDPGIRAQLEGPSPTGEIAIVDLNGEYAQNVEAGNIFVVTGRAVNNTDKARSFFQVKGNLFNKMGEKVAQSEVYCGNIFSRKEIETLPRGKIETDLKNKVGGSLSNINLAPGKSVPFMIVFFKLPAEMSEFSAEVTGSQPGIQLDIEDPFKPKDATKADPYTPDNESKKKNGKLSIYTEYKYGTTDVYIDGVLMGQLSSRFPAGAPAPECEQEGTINKALTPGSHRLYAKNSDGTSWEFTVNIKEGLCHTFRLSKQ